MVAGVAYLTEGLHLPYGLLAHSVTGDGLFTARRLVQHPPQVQQWHGNSSLKGSQEGLREPTATQGRRLALEANRPSSIAEG